jgi:hypothetical protein
MKKADDYTLYNLTLYNLKMEAVNSSETLLHLYQLTCGCMLEDSELQRKCCENLKSNTHWKGLGLSPMIYTYVDYEHLH